MRPLLFVACSVLGLAAPPAPALLPGEGLAVLEGGGTPQIYGEARLDRPMGSLAKMLWLRFAGDDWAAWDVRYKCRGEEGGASCWLHKGHGRLHLASATEESCNLAYLAWARRSFGEDARQYGEAAARIRLEEVFRPFLGTRLPPGDALPVLGPAWVGDGDLLRTSPAAFLAWLAEPGQERLLTMMERLLIPIHRRDPGAWWMKTGTAPVPGDPAATAAWVAGSNGQRMAVLYLPRGRGKAEGLARFRQLMGLPPRS